MRIFLGLGTNLGDRPANLRAALDALAPQIALQSVSNIYETAPWGYTDQPAFLNQAAAAETELEPLELLGCLKAIETGLGRAPTFRYGPRLIDLDILFYGCQVLNLPGLTIPHPRIPERAFVLVPLAELAPDLVHPGLGVTIQALLAQVDASGVTCWKPTEG